LRGNRGERVFIEGPSGSGKSTLAGIFDRKIRLCDINHIRPINATSESEKCLV
jgi:ABC-type lipoprotein export system ATPase subunit